MEPLSDEELVVRYRSRAPGPDREWLIDELFKRHYRRVGAWCYRLAGDWESGADLAQEIFAKAFGNLDSFRGDSKFTTWLYAITRNHCNNELVARAARIDRSGEALDVDVADTRQMDAFQLLAREQSAKHVRELMQSCLDETESRVMVLHYAEGMPLDAVTRLLGLTNASGAKAYIVSAKRKLNIAVRRLPGKSKTRGAEG